MPRARRLAGVCAVSVPLALVGFGAVGGVASGTPGPVSRPQILYPGGGAAVCSGRVLLAGKEQNQAIAGGSESARWAYSIAGGAFQSVTAAAPAPVDPPSPVYERYWDTPGTGSSPATLRFTLGQGGSARTATARFTLEQPPPTEPLVATTNPETGVTLLSQGLLGAGDRGATRAHQDQEPEQVDWYLGDGTHLTTGPTGTVAHHFKPGDYVIMVRRTRSGCSGALQVVLLHVPQEGTQVLPVVSWCDPLGVDFKHKGQSDPWSPPETEIGLGSHSEAPKPLPLGPLHNNKAQLGFGFEIKFKVFGNPAKCTTHQYIGSLLIIDFGRNHKEWISPPPNGDASSDLEDDDYDKDGSTRRTLPDPSADGTATINWLDYPVLKDEPTATGAQRFDHVVATISGSEAPIPHPGETETTGKGSGESSYVDFHMCSSWISPDKTAGGGVKYPHVEAGPDALPPVPRLYGVTTKPAEYKDSSLSAARCP